MKNKDMPAMPVDNVFLKGKYSDERVPTLGLTKREYFAGLAMQGMCSDSECKCIKTLALNSVVIADELLAALEGGSDETYNCCY